MNQNAPTKEEIEQFLEEVRLISIEMGIGITFAKHVTFQRIDDWKGSLGVDGRYEGTMPDSVHFEELNWYLSDK